MKKFLTVILILVFIPTNSHASANINEIEKIYNETAGFAIKNITTPYYGSVGGEWLILGLLRGDASFPEEFIEIYREKLKQQLILCNGILHKRKYTEYSRVILTLTALKENPADFENYDLIKNLFDYENVTYQGINGAVWALIAIDSGKYNLPREVYIDAILKRQNTDGGFSLLKDGISEADITAMVLCALSNYKEREDVDNAIQKALSWLSSSQNENGGFSGFSIESSESTAQVIIALCTLNIGIEDQRFIKNGISLYDNMMSYYDSNGGFLHSKNDTQVNQMSTEQCLLALASLKRFYRGEKALFSITEPKKYIFLPICYNEKIVTDLMINNYGAKLYETEN